MTWPAPVWARAAVVLLSCVGLFAVLIEVVRAWEAEAAVRLLGLLGLGDALVVAPATILVVPAEHGSFVAVVTRGCSSLGSVLAASALFSLVFVGPPSRKLWAVVSTAALIVAANLLRLVASIAVGLWLGSSALVLFHNWAAALFAFLYVLAALVLGLSILLPADSEAVALESTT